MADCILNDMQGFIDYRYCHADVVIVGQTRHLIVYNDGERC